MADWSFDAFNFDSGLFLVLDQCVNSMITSDVHHSFIKMLLEDVLIECFIFNAKVTDGL